MHRKFSFNTIKVLINSFCNLECRHCYQHDDKNKYSLSPDILIEIIDFAHANNTRVLDFGGGEFFVHPYAYSLLEYCSSKQMRVNIATNATSLSLDFFSQFDDLSWVTFQLSVDGLQPSHDSRRGVGSFKKMIENAKALNDMGVKLTACIAVDEDNYFDLYEVIQLPYFERFIIMPVAYVGAASRGGFDISSKRLADYEETMSFILKNTDNENDTFQSQIFPQTLSIKYDGCVFPSPVASDYGLFCFGNIYSESLTSLTNRFLNDEKAQSLLMLDSSSIYECNLCDSQSECNRGCRFRALKFFGSMLKPDPFCCRIYKNKFSNIPLGDLYWGNNTSAMVQ